MDRRRYMPSSLGLESRVVLSTTPVSAAVVAATPVPAAESDASTTAATTTSSNQRVSATATNVAPTSSAAQTIQQRVQRVQNLPFFLAQFQQGRFIPADSMKQVQANLLPLITRLSPAPTSALSNYNLQIRKIQSNTSLSQSDIQTLNFAFGRVLTAAKADPTLVANLQAGMLGLARADADSINPVMLAINDYSLTLQTALGIGRPLNAPSVPSLQTSDRLNGAPNTSKTATPTYIGTYQPNATMQIFDQAGNVLGSAATLSNGTYTLKLTTPLPNGTYKLQIRAVDTGYTSLPSRFFTLKVKVPVTVASVPKGPMYT